MQMYLGTVRCRCSITIRSTENLELQKLRTSENVLIVHLGLGGGVTAETEKHLKHARTHTHT